ncbi:helix-turn-helix domain-containing protein [Streptomyces sp. NPDC054796]
MAEPRGYGGGLDGLLREVRRQACRAEEPDVQKVLDWAHRHTGAHIALVTESGEGGEEGAVTPQWATAGFPAEVLRRVAPLLARLSGGRLAAAATEAGGWHVRCEALGTREPRLLLVAAARSAPGPEESALLSHTGSVITLLRRAEDGERVWRGFQYKARQVRFAVLSALMAGEPALARRMTTGAVPPLLEAGRLRIHLLHCPPAERERIVRAHQDPSGYHGADLMVQCPAFKEHLICLIADGTDGTDGTEGTDSTDGAGDTDGTGGRDADGPSGPGGPDGPAHGRAGALHRLVRDNPGYALGISGTHALDATAGAYSQAAHALAVARTTPGRVAAYQGRTPLGGVLPGAPAFAWARDVLRPLDTLPTVTRDITRLLTAAPRSVVAGLLGLSRNTVTAHIRRAERALDMDLNDVRSRAALHLALAVTGACAAPEPGEEQQPPALEDLLRTERAVAWARTFLRPLRDPRRRTLQAWIDANTDAQHAARRLGISRNTVRAHLHAAEAALSRDLLTTGVGTYDVVHALRITAIRAD